MGTDEGLPVLGVKTVARPRGDRRPVAACARPLGGNRGSGADRPREGHMSVARSLSIRLLGRLEIRAGTLPIRIGGRHAQALIALLALRPRLRLRDTIAAELWPDADGPWLPRSARRCGSSGRASPPSASPPTTGSRPTRIPWASAATSASTSTPTSSNASPSSAAATTREGRCPVRRRSPRGARPRVLRRRPGAPQRRVRGPPGLRRRPPPRAGRHRGCPGGRLGAPAPGSAARGGAHRPDRDLRPHREPLAGRPAVPPAMHDSPVRAGRGAPARDG